MKKIIYVFVFCLLFTGCSTDIDVYISNSYIDQRISTELSPKDIVNNDPLSTIKDEYVKINHTQETFSLFDIDVRDNEVMGRIKKNNDINEILLITGSDDYYIDDNYYNFNLKVNHFDCFEQYTMMDDMTINFHINNGIVVNHNADFVQGNIYTWNFDKNNYKNKTLQIKINKNSIIEEQNKEEKKQQKKIYIIIGGFLLLISGGITYIILNNKMKQKDKI